MLLEEQRRQDDAMRAEYAKSYAQVCTDLGLLMEQAIASRDETLLTLAMELGSQQTDLMLLVGESLEIQRLYLASAMTMFVTAAEQGGLPKDVSQSIKRKYFALLAAAGQQQELLPLQFGMARELIAEAHRYSMQGYAPLVKMAIQYIHNNKFRLVSAGEVAQALHLNRSYLSTLFARETGSTLAAYIRNAKMQLAADMLSTHLYRPGEVAELLGYTDYAPFSRSFTKVHGVSPKQFGPRNDEAALPMGQQ